METTNQVSPSRDVAMRFSLHYMMKFLSLGEQIMLNQDNPFKFGDQAKSVVDQLARSKGVQSSIRFQFLHLNKEAGDNLDQVIQFIRRFPPSLYNTIVAMHPIEQISSIKLYNSLNDFEKGILNFHLFFYFVRFTNNSSLISLQQMVLLNLVHSVFILDPFDKLMSNILPEILLVRCDFY